MRRAAAILLYAITAAIIASSLALAANNPGHDTLYVEEQGNSTINGSLNITVNLTVYGQTDIRSLGLFGNGVVPSSGAFIAYENGGAERLYISNPGNLLLKSTGGGQVQVGSVGTASDLNVTGNIYAYGNKAVCLENGTGCPASALGGGNVTGSGSANYVPLWSSSTQLGNSIIWANSTNVGVGTNAPRGIMTVDKTESNYTDWTTMLLLNRTGSGTGGELVLDNLGTNGRGSRIILYRPGSGAEAKLYFASNLDTTGMVLGLGYAGTNSLVLSDISTSANIITVEDNTGNNTLYLRNTGTGYVGVGTTAPNQKLDVNGSINVSGGSRNIWIDNSRVCTEDNGLCGGGGYTQWQLGSNTGTTSAISNNTLVNITGTGSITTTKTVNNISIDITDDMIDGTELKDAIALDANLAITGYNITFDTNTLHVDSTGDGVGIGTTTPKSTLHLLGGGYSRPVLNVTGSSTGGEIWLIAGARNKTYISSGDVSGGYPSTGAEINLTGPMTGGGDVYISSGDNFPTPSEGQDYNAGNVYIRGGLAPPTFEGQSGGIGGSIYIDAGSGSQNGAVYLARSSYDTVSVGNAPTTTRFNVNGSGNFSGTNAQLWVNGSLVCTSTNGLCGSAGGGGGWTNTTTQVYLANNATNVSIGTTPTLFVDTANARIGIGTAPARKVDASMGTNGVAFFTSGTGGGSSLWGESIGFISAGSVGAITTVGTAPITFNIGGTPGSMTGGTEYMRISTSGNVGIGTTAPTSKLEVNGSVNVTSGNVTVQSTYSMCFNANCSSRIYHNGTSLVIEGQA